MKCRRLVGPAIISALFLAACGGGGSSATATGSPTPAPTPSPTPSPTPPPPAGNASASLAWTANTEGDLQGYRVYYGSSSGSYFQQTGGGVDAGQATQFVVNGLVAGQTYYFALSAYDSAGNESALSNEVSRVVQ